jgi:hypothetical protein
VRTPKALRSPLAHETSGPPQRTGVLVSFNR